MITIVADTTSSLPLETASQLGVPMLPQIIIFGENSYRDDTELDSASFLKLLRSSTTLPKTAAPPPELYHPIFKNYSEKGNTIVVICPSADVSGTVRSATVAAQDFPDADIRIIDSRTIGCGLGTLVKQAVLLANQGIHPDKLVEHIEAMSKRQRVYFLVDTLEYLHKGGRIGGATALVGGILQVKPILQFLNGRVEQFEKQRTKTRALARLEELVVEQCPHNENGFLTIMHGDAEEDARSLASSLKAKIGVQDILIFQIPPAIIVHGGPGVLATSFFVEE